MNALRRLRARLTREEDGWVVVVAVVVMVLMVGIGLALLKQVDTQQSLGGQSRMRESSFNVAEGLITNEAQILQHNWPRASTSAYVSTCTQTGGVGNPTNQCPDPLELLGSTAAFNNVDENSGGLTTWQVQVRDDTGAVSGVNPTYDSATVPLNPSWDANGNRQMWVRATAFVRGKKRVLVELLQLEKLNVPFSGGALTAGTANFTNAGDKTIVYTQGSPPVIVRCAVTPSMTLSQPMSAGGTAVIDVSTPTALATFALFVPGMHVDIVQPGGGGNGDSLIVASTSVDAVAKTGTITFQAPGAQNPHVAGSSVARSPGPTNLCEQWNTPGTNGNNKNPQLYPQWNYVSSTTASTGLKPADLELIEDGAVTYPAGTCPSNTAGAWAGPIVIKQAPAGGCTMATPSNGVLNGPATNPAYGFVIVEDQVNPATGPALSIPNNTTFFGIVYALNRQNAGTTPPTPGAFSPVITMGGNAQVCGGVAIDGNGGITIGSANNGNSGGCVGGNGGGASIVYDPQAFIAFGAAGAAGLVQNTWRELPPSEQ